MQERNNIFFSPKGSVSTSIFFLKKYIKYSPPPPPPFWR